MTENRKQFIEAYYKYRKSVPDTRTIAKELGLTVRSVQTLISKYRREGLIKDEETVVK